MPVARLAITLRNTDSAISRLQAHVADAHELAPRFQNFIAEMVMLRLFSIFESSVAELAYKLAAGASYTNGTLPALSVRANSMNGSRGLFLSHGRTKSRQNLQWTKASYIRESVRYVMPDTEMFVFNVRAHGAVIEEMRRVRNVLGHQTPSARQLYKRVLRQEYGANVQVAPGAFLLSTNRNPTSKLNSYLASTRLILADAARGS